MLSNQKLFSVGNFDFRLQHLLIIGVLILAFSISMLIRSTPLQYGFELFEFDPFFNFRATEYIIENGYDAYFQWNDEKSWHPFGRNISDNSQVMLHVTSSIFYKLFGFNSSLYDFTILFPLVVGSLTAIIVFAFVRVLGGTTAGLFAALIFSISAPILSRGLIGWFKSEPLGLFLGFLAMYLFVSGIMNNRGKSSLIKLLFAGIFLSLGLSAWGGTLFFLIPIIGFYFALPFMKKESNFIILSTCTFSAFLILFSLLFERTSSFTIGYAGVLILFSTIFVIACELIKKFSHKSNHIRNCIIFLISIPITIVGIFSSGIVNLPAFRYLTALNPFLTSTDPLTDSVSEHMTTTIDASFSYVSVFIIFGMIGIWFLLSRKTIDLNIDKRIFALIIGISAIYVSSSFVRLELFASVGLIVLGSIGIAILSKKIFESNIFSPTKILYCGVMVTLFLIPTVLPEDLSWTSWANFPPTIKNGGSHYVVSNNDWQDAMSWLRTNTPEDAIIASWWDYGYWITTLSDRTTIIDNATLIDWQIKKMAHSLISPPEKSWHILNSHHSEDISEYLGDETIKNWGGPTDFITYETWLSSDESNKDCKSISLTEAKQSGTSQNSCFPVGSGLDADYILIFISGNKISIPDKNIFLYTLDGGGDESKAEWYIKISDNDVRKFIENDGVTPTPYYMEQSLLGKLTPFSIFKYVEPETTRTFDKYQFGLVPVFYKDIKYIDPENDPFYLVYASPSFYTEIPGPMTAVLIYKINSDYQF